MTERGYQLDKYPIGVALSLSPAFLSANAIAARVWPNTHDPRFRPNGYSPVYQCAIYIMVLIWGLATMMLIDHVLADHFGFGPIAALAAILTFWLGSHYIWYYLREPIMSHAISTFWVTLSIVACLEIIRDAQAGRIHWMLPPLLTFALSMAVVCRPTNLFIAPLLVLTAWMLLRERLLLSALFRTPWPIGLAPVAAQLWLWHATSGNWIYYSYGQEGFNWSHPHLWSTLFSTRHGLFVWSPLLLAAPIGIAWHWRSLRSQHGTVISFLMCAGTLWYLNSAWHCWWFGWAFGARAFLELAVVYALGLACFYEQIGLARPAVRRRLIYVTIAAILYSYALMNLYLAGKIPADGYWF
jgi:hypothetical protein